MKVCKYRRQVCADREPCPIKGLEDDWGEWSWLLAKVGECPQAGVLIPVYEKGLQAVKGHGVRIDAEEWVQRYAKPTA